MVTKTSMPVLSGECTNCGRCVEVCDDDALNFSIKKFSGKDKMKLGKLTLAVSLAASILIAANTKML